MKSLEEQQRIREKHQSRVKDSKRIRRQRIDVELKGSLQVAKEGSNLYFERIAIMFTPLTNQYFFVSYNKTLPDGLSLLAPEYQSGDYIIHEIGGDKANIVLGAISHWERYKHYHINPYSTLILYSLERGLDLVAEGYIKI